MNNSNAWLQFALYVGALDGDSAARALQDVLAFDPQNARAIEMLQELGYEIVDENEEAAMGTDPAADTDYGSADHASGDAEIVGDDADVADSPPKASTVTTAISAPAGRSQFPILASSAAFCSAVNMPAKSFTNPAGFPGLSYAKAAFVPFRNSANAARRAKAFVNVFI